MKLLTIAIPCYNSSAYMRKAIGCALIGGDDVEILIIDDGSTKDNTLEIAQEYEAEYPGIVRAIHQENKGHGGAVNTGIENASGLYFKVCDSDDWFDEEAFRRLLAALKKIAQGRRKADVVFTNYIYDKVDKAGRKFVMKYSRFMPEDRLFGWDGIRELDTYHYVLMHSLTYRTQVLRDSGLKLPEHTFYVDNIYAYVPFSKVRTMYYCNADLYHYYIGRSDQSVNEEVMLGRMGQQIRVNEIMIDYLNEMKGMDLHPKQRRYMLHYLSVIMAITTQLVVRAGTPEALRQKKEIWQRLKTADSDAYRMLRTSPAGIGANLPGPGGRLVIRIVFRIMQRIYGFE